MLRELAPDLYCAEASLRFLGLPMGARMTVVRLPGGDLLVHSPVLPTPALLEGLAALGTVRFVVGPNRFHHLHLGALQAAFPSALLYGAPGLPEKRRDLAFHATLGERAPDAWGGAFEQTLVEGLPLLNEVALYHRASRTLLLTDVCFHHPHAAEEPFLMRSFLKFEGSAGRVAVPRTMRLLIRDRRAFRRSTDRILAWDFDRVVLSHGDVVDDDARAGVERAFSTVT